MESLKNLLKIPHVHCGPHLFHIVLVGLLNEDLISSSFQFYFVFIRKGSIASFEKVMVEGSVGVLWRADGHLGEVQVIDGVGGDRGGNRGRLPFVVGLGYQKSSRDESKTYKSRPENFSCPCLII